MDTPHKIITSEAKTFIQDAHCECGHAALPTGIVAQREDAPPQYEHQCGGCKTLWYYAEIYPKVVQRRVPWAPGKEGV